jgi:hypothetical protein
MVLEYKEVLLDRLELKAELRRQMQADFEALVDEVARSVNAATAGRVIADSEQAVRDATAEFRRRLYQQAIALRAQAEGPAFSPSAGRGDGQASQGSPDGDVSDDQRSGDD